MQIDIQTLNKALGNIDLYLLDQILKGRFDPSMKVLDAGCGEGRNLSYFIQNGYEVHGVDTNPSAIQMLKFVASSLNRAIDKHNFQVAPVEKLPYEGAYFDLVICNAVLHFAQNHDHFHAMFSELCRVAKPDAYIFIRTASSIGMEDKIKEIAHGVYHLPDGSHRYLIHRNQAETLTAQFGLAYIESFKTVVVDAMRSMSTLICRKSAQ